MFIDDCNNCEFLIGPCDGSIFIRTSTNCTVSLISKQLRFRECHDIKIYAYCLSDPVVESSTNIFFGPFNYNFPKAKELFLKGSFTESKIFFLKKEENKFEKVYDFSEKTNLDRIHWRIMNKGEFQENNLKLKEEDQNLNESLYDGYSNEYKDLLKENNFENSKNSNNLNVEINNIEEIILTEKNIEINAKENQNNRENNKKEEIPNLIIDIEIFNNLNSKKEKIEEDIFVNFEKNEVNSDITSQENEFNYNQYSSNEKINFNETNSNNSKNQFCEFQIIDKEENKSLSSYQNISIRDQNSNENSETPELKITIASDKILKVDDYFSDDLENNSPIPLEIGSISNKISTYENNFSGPLENFKVNCINTDLIKDTELITSNFTDVSKQNNFERIVEEERLKRIKEKKNSEYEQKIKLREKAFEYIITYEK